MTTTTPTAYPPLSSPHSLDLNSARRIPTATSSSDRHNISFHPTHRQHTTLSPATIPFDDWPSKMSSTDLSYSSSTSLAPETLVVLPQHHQLSHSQSPAFWRRFLPESTPCRLYILVVVLQTLVDLAIEGVLVLKFQQAANIDPTPKQDQSPTQRLPVYFTIFGLAHVFQFILAVDSVCTRNTLQLMFLAAFNLILLCYAIVQIGEIHEAALPVIASNGILALPLNVLARLIPSVIGIAEIVYLILGWSIWREFGWKDFKHLGADRRVKSMYMHYQILQCIMKFDVFFWTGFSIQLIWMVLQKMDVEYAVTIAALPASLVVLVAGYLGSRYEHRPLMYAFMLSCVGACAYFTFKLFRIVEQRNLPNIAPVHKSLTVFATTAIVFLVATFTWACIVLSNFGAGLKQQMSKERRPIQPTRTKKGTQPLDVDLSGHARSKSRRLSLE
jgi:hypothetical protein